MDTLIQDVRFAIRSLLRTPAVTLVAVVTLALGIGANTAIFSVLNAVLLRPLPFRDPAGLVMVWEHSARTGNDHNVVSPANYLDWRRENTVFADLAAYVDWRTTVTGFDQPEQVPIAYTTARFLPLLGVAPQAGRWFSEREDAPNGENVVVLSYAAWQRWFGGSPQALGRTIVMDGRPATIVGVMPRGFGASLPRAFNRPGTTPDIYAPLGLDPARNYRERSGRYLITFARLKPGVTIDRAQADIGTIAARLAAAYPVFNAGWSTNVVGLTEQLVGGVRRAILLLTGVVGLVLLIACANVANLQLARAAARQRELAVRAALGASRRRIVRQLLTDSVILSLAGGVLGVLLAAWATGALSVLAAASLPRVSEVQLDAATLLFTFAISLLTGVVFGLVPAVQASRHDLHEVLKEGARGTTAGGRIRAALLVSQVALSMMLLVGAGLLIRSFVRLEAETPGFNPDRVLTARVELPGRVYDSDTRQVAFFTDLLARVRRLPGVAAASAINWLPFGGLGSATRVYVEGRPVPPPSEELVADIRGVEPEYFRAMEIALIQGTPFTDRDNAAARKAIVVNQTLARQFFPGANPIGQHILMPWGDTLRGEIVAVVGDTKHMGLDSLPRPMIYWAMPQFPSNFMSLVIRTTGDPLALAPLVTGAVRAIDANQPVADIKLLDAYLAQSVAQRRFTMALMAAFAAVALLLAAVGIYGVLAYSVAQRTREIGVRVALGARRATVQMLVIRQGMGVVLGGIAVGAAGALALTRVMASLLYRTGAADPLTFLAVALTLGGSALLACWVPARRAARIDPMEALRAE